MILTPPAINARREHCLDTREFLKHPLAGHSKGGFALVHKACSTVTEPWANLCPLTFSRTAVTRLAPTSWSPTSVLQQHSLGLPSTFSWPQPGSSHYSSFVPSCTVFSATALLLFTPLLPKLKLALPFVRYIKNGQWNPMLYYFSSQSSLSYAV